MACPFVRVRLEGMKTMHTLADLRRVAEQMWPSDTAEDWDRVGLVTGQNDAPLRRVLLAVDPVYDTVNEAVEWGADALLTHHPLMLRGVHSIAEDTAKGSLLAALLRGNCALLAAHTNADIPEDGVSDRIAVALKLSGVEPIVAGNTPETGLGRVGELRRTMTLNDLAKGVANVLPKTATGIRVAGDPDRLVKKVALCGGAGDSLLDHDLVRSADVYITSDLRHHPAQESLEQSNVTGGPALIDVSHWASESLWLETAAQQLAEALPGLEVRVSNINTDPWTFRVS